MLQSAQTLQIGLGATIYNVVPSTPEFPQQVLDVILDEPLVQNRRGESTRLLV